MYLYKRLNILAYIYKANGVHRLRHIEYFFTHI